MKQTAPLRVGISACLLGQKVRYDGGHKRDDFAADLLGRFVEFVPVCPEMEIGLGTPRESIHLKEVDGDVRLVAPRSGRDLTEDMHRYAGKRADALAREDLCGFILKKGSPSCGLERVSVHRSGPPTKSGVGFFARALLARWPDLPVEDEGRLNDPRLRENFLERVFATHRLRGLEKGLGALVRFHTAEKLLLMAHDPASYQTLGRLVANGKGRPWGELTADYRSAFLRALAVLPTRSRHVNALQHAAGYFRDKATEAERRELAGAIEDFRRELVPLIVPVTLLRSAARVHGVDYLIGQTYLSPHPKELMLRNHA